jgi:hypothetical protein
MYSDGVEIGVLAPVIAPPNIADQTSAMTRTAKFRGLRAVRRISQTQEAVISAGFLMKTNAVCRSGVRMNVDPLHRYLPSLISGDRMP